MLQATHELGYLSRNIGEVTPERPKYRFAEGLHKQLELYGSYELKVNNTLPLRIVYLVESPLTVLKFHQLGLAAVSPFGWSVSFGQLKLLMQVAKGVICLPDSNKYAEAQQVAGMLAGVMWCRMPPLPKNVEDPEHLSLEQIKALT